MKFEEFNEKWSEAFGAMLTARNGAAAWADFVEDQRTSDGLLMKVLGEFAADYTAMCKDMSPHAKNAIPTCRAFRDRYFEYIKARNPVAPSNCTTCGGRGIVFALSPCRGDGDRMLAPEDWRTVSLERVYPFAEHYACPVCHASAYVGREALRQRLIANSLPEIVRADDPRNVYRCAIGGDRLIQWSIADRRAAKIAADDRELEDAFPTEARA